MGKNKVWHTEYQQCMEKNEEEEEREPKYVLTMGSYACECHHRWRMQTAWTDISRVPHLNREDHGTAKVLVLTVDWSELTDSLVL